MIRRHVTVRSTVALFVSHDVSVYKTAHNTEGAILQPSQPARNTQAATGLGWFSIGLGLAELLAPDYIARFIGAPAGGPTRAVLRSFGVREMVAGLGILAKPSSAAWVWGRVAGDVLDISAVAAAMFKEGANRARGSAAIAALAGVTALDYYVSDRMSQRASVA